MHKRDRMLQALREQPMTTADLADWLDECKTRVNALIRYHRAYFRIADWKREKRHIVAVWGVADGQPDKPKPRPLTPKERAARYKKPRRALLAAKSRKSAASPWQGL